MNKNKYICIHGHFYQPPRENPWLDRVEQQESAKPYHDWNERINFECYAPNAVARILDSEGTITQIRNNYKRISFNFGPTLLSWMEVADPITYAAIQDADKRSMELFGGHGNAMAQVHSHLILPLCNHRDKVTQVQWGIRDFERRFERYPEGMWLAESAVDLESLEVLAAHGIRYTVLAPRQAQSIRELEGAWSSVNESTLNTKRAYWCTLPSGRRIALFFYNGSIAKDVAFSGLLNSGMLFAQHLTSAFSQNDDAELVHIATDGESYGHHHRHGEMALAHCLWNIENDKKATLTNYGQFLELFPPTHEVKIWQNSSWSCVHGVERWRSNCGCTSRSEWHQKWRAPLRAALDFLRDRFAPAFEQEAKRFLRDPWAARNDYINIINDKSPESKVVFLKKHAKRKLSPKDEVHIFRLLELQKHCILMYTSCAWFFDDISRIETSQVLQYALRALEYGKDALGLDLKKEFIALLEKAPSNALENGAVSFKKNVVPARVDLKRVAMHYAATAVFFEGPPKHDVFNFYVDLSHESLQISGSQKLATGQLNIRSKITGTARQYSFAVLHLGAQHIIGNISEDMPLNDFLEMQEALSKIFEEGQVADVFGAFQKYFGPEKFTLESLFKEEQIRLINQIAEKSLSAAAESLRESYRESYPLMIALNKDNLPIPEGFLNIANFVLKNDIRLFYESDASDLSSLIRLVDDLKRWNLEMNEEHAIERAAEERIYREIQKINLQEANILEAQRLIALLEKTLLIEGLTLELWKIQNHFYKLSRGYRKGIWSFESVEWEEQVRRLGTLLKVRFPEVEEVA